MTCSVVNILCLSWMRVVKDAISPLLDLDTPTNCVSGGYTIFMSVC